MNTGRVYWITGLHNSGKTTIGTALYYELRKTHNNLVILDGDIMKQIASGSELASYSQSDRLTRAKRYSTIAKLLADQGLWVIVCAIAMFDEVRAWNRENIKGYVEVFLDAPEDVLYSRDRKGLLNSNEKHEYLQLPKHPDITIINDNDSSIREAVQLIKSFTPSNEEDFARDKEYWNKFYSSNAFNTLNVSNISNTSNMSNTSNISNSSSTSNNLENLESELLKPSQFARDIVRSLQAGKHVLELGCGNGRDSLFFLKNGLRVTALDASDIAVENLNTITANNDNALFVCDNFVKCQILYQLKYDYIYSRFTLHAITEEQENELLENVKTALDKDGILFIEARTTKDEIYGKGKEVGHNAFIYNDHFRRFIDVEEFKEKIERMGFEVISIQESNGFSKTATSDPVLMRLIAKIATPPPRIYFIAQIHRQRLPSIYARWR